MSFTLFSVILLLFVGFAVYIEIMRGLKHGFVRTAISLSVVLLSAVLAAIPAAFLSDLPTDYLAQLLFKNVSAINKYSETLPSLKGLLTAAIDALLTPIVFAILFPLIRLILRGIVRAICKKRWRDPTNDPRPAGAGRSAFSSDSPNYTQPNAPWYERHNRVLGGVVGGACGFLATLLILSPLLGTVSTASMLLRHLQSGELKVSGLDLNNKTMAQIEPYINDATLAALAGTGGNLIYDGIATSKITYTVVEYDDNGKVVKKEQKEATISIRHELDECLSLSLDLITVLKSLSGGQQMTEEETELIGNLGSRIDDSPAMRVIATDFVTTACKKWLAGEAYLGMEKPDCGEYLDPVFNGVLRVCGASDADCIGGDITTLMNVYRILMDADLHLGSGSLNNLMENDEILDHIYAELAANPCMAGLTDTLADDALFAMVSAIDLSSLTEQQKNEIWEKLNDSLYLVNSMDGTDAEKITRMTDYTIKHAEHYGVKLPESVTSMAATTLVQELRGEKNLSVEQLKAYLEKKAENRYTSNNP